MSVKSNLIQLVVGFDEREAVVFHSFVQSILTRSSLPVQVLPLAVNTLVGYEEMHEDASNAFVYSRFLTPYLMSYEGWALFCDGDMVCNDDIAELWKLRDESKAVQVVKHDYETKASVKYFGNKNENYPRKNWSSVVLWNCAHPKHKILTPELVNEQTGKFLHRFQWLEDNEIGGLPLEWNWLDVEYDRNPNASLIHYTLGAPCFSDYKDSPMSAYWHQSYAELNKGFDSI
jgi:lipopolysaccharide biosynthesis glycosyltransferase